VSVIATHFQLSSQARNLPAAKLGPIQYWFLGVLSKVRFKSVAVVATSLRSDSSICSFNASGPGRTSLMSSPRSVRRSADYLLHHL
jgi:hypothetical protein